MNGKIVLGFSVLTFLIAGFSTADQMVQNAPPRTLAAENASEGLFPGMNYRFTIPNYWDYGNFEPKECVELPGKLFRATAHGQQCRQVFLISGHEKWSPDQPRISLSTGRLYAAWRVRDPNPVTPGGRYSCVHPGSTTWQIWLEKRSPDTAVWHIQRTKNGKILDDTILALPRPDGWHEVRLALEPTSLEFEINSKAPIRFEHDAYPGSPQMHFGSVQPDSSGPPVVSEFRYVFFNRFPYPHSSADTMPEGPEDIGPEDRVIRLRVAAATPESPRHSEGDVIALKDGSLLLIWSDYFQGKGWDQSPARLSGQVSRDGGRNWSSTRTIVDYDPDSPGGNVMSVSLLRESNGDILLAYHDRTREMKAKGMVLRRSSDEGRTWSGSRFITPNTGNVHTANNAGFRKLRSGRIVLACREYVDGIRWPYALYSDDAADTWKSGRRVPEPALSIDQVKAQNVNEPSIAELSDGRLIMMMRSVAGGHFFSYSSDGGESWTQPQLSPLRGLVAPPYIGTVPATGDLLAIWSYGLTARTPLNSAISKDGGKTWSPVKLLEQSENFGYGYTSVNFVKDRVLLTTSQYPLFSSLERFAADPGYIDLLFVSLPLEWFYRLPK